MVRVNIHDFYNNTLIKTKNKDDEKSSFLFFKSQRYIRNKRNDDSDTSDKTEVGYAELLNHNLVIVSTQDIDGRKKLYSFGAKGQKEDKIFGMRILEDKPEKIKIYRKRTSTNQMLYYLYKINKLKNTKKLCDTTAVDI